jgi:hypothetical protein
MLKIWTRKVNCWWDSFWPYSNMHWLSSKKRKSTVSIMFEIVVNWYWLWKFLLKFNIKQTFMTWKISTSESTILSFISDLLTYHKQNKCLTINNNWVDVYSKLIWQYWTWINDVRVSVNDLSISIVDQWPFVTILFISFGDIPQCVPRLQQILPSCIGLHHMNDHDEEWSHIQSDRQFLIQIDIDNQIWSIFIQLLPFLISSFAFPNHNSLFRIKSQFWLIDPLVDQ